MTRRAAFLVVTLVVAALVGVGLLATPGSPLEQRPTLGLDLQGGLEVTLQAVPPRDRELTKEDLDRSVSIMRDRVDKLGVAEPEIRTQGDDQISIQLPGVKDPAAAASIIGKTAQLELFDLQANLVAPSIDVRTRQPIATPRLYDLLAGQQALAAKGAIVKRLRSVETLGSTSAICSDKTGTLTLNQMTARELVVVGRRYAVEGEGYSTEGRIQRVAGETDTALDPFLLPMALANDAAVREGEIVGDPTEAALVVLADRGGLDVEETRRAYPRVAEVPFDSEYKLMATFHEMESDGRPVVRCFVKGAPDVLLARSTHARGADGSRVSLDDARDRVHEVLAVVEQDERPPARERGADRVGQ